jgi:hypothetical protein
MMIKFTKEQVELYDKLEKTTDTDEIKKIRKRLHEISIERDKELENCPFVH